VQPIEYDGKVVLLPRVIRRGYTKRQDGRGYDNYVSEIWLATGDGINFTLSDIPVIKPEPDHPYDEWGCEDPRIAQLDDRYLITYTALSEPAYSAKGDRIGLASTLDFSTFEKHGVIGPPEPSKAAVFFPERVNGSALLLLTNKINKKIYLASYDRDVLDRAGWENYWKDWVWQENVVLQPRYNGNNGWEAKEVETGAQPIKTPHGWLLIYSGISHDPTWSIGAALLDLENPREVIARSPRPILQPEMEYERVGDVPNVTFTDGAIVRGDELFVYYGGADKVCALATCNVNDLADLLLENSR